jgi:hypothetical protein
MRLSSHQQTVARPLTATMSLSRFPSVTWTHRRASASRFDEKSGLSTPVRNYGDVFRLGGRSQPFGGELGQKGVKIAASEGPFERRCRPFIVTLEGKETLFKVR